MKGFYDLIYSSTQLNEIIITLVDICVIIFYCTTNKTHPTSLINKDYATLLNNKAHPTLQVNKFDLILIS